MSIGGAGAPLARGGLYAGARVRGQVPLRAVRSPGQSPLLASRCPGLRAPARSDAAPCTCCRRSASRTSGEFRSCWCRGTASHTRPGPWPRRVGSAGGAGPVRRSDAASASPGMKRRAGPIRVRSSASPAPTERTSRRSAQARRISRSKTSSASGAGWVSSETARNTRKSASRKARTRAERGAGLGRAQLDLHQHRMGAFLVQPPGLQSPRHEVFGSRQVLARRRQPVTAHGVQEVEQRVAARQVEPMCAWKEHALNSNPSSGLDR